MRSWHRRLTLGLGVLMTLVGCGGGGASAPSSPQKPPPKGSMAAETYRSWRPLTVAFAADVHVTKGLYRSLQHQGYLTAFAPFWYHVTFDGTFENRDPKATSVPKPDGLRVTPLVNQYGFPW